MNKVYELKVWAKGDSFEFFVNNQSVLKATDATYKSGSIGFRTYEAQAVYDNVEVGVL